MGMLVVGAQHDDLAVVDRDPGDHPCRGAPKTDTRSEWVPMLGSEYYVDKLNDNQLAGSTPI